MFKQINLIMIVISALFIFSCTDNAVNDNEVELADDVAGQYNGIINDELNEQNYSATVNISEISNTSVRMEFNSEIMDTTIDFNLYQNGDSLMMCFEGEAFERHYGHQRMGQHGHMMHSQNWNWNHHLDEDHQPGEEHFGHFSMHDDSLHYEFHHEDTGNIMYVFEGMRSVNN